MTIEFEFEPRAGRKTLALICWKDICRKRHLYSLLKVFPYLERWFVLKAFWYYIINLCFITVTKVDTFCLAPLHFTGTFL